MIESTPNRRHVLAMGLTSALWAFTGFAAGNAALAAPTSPRPFAGSRTVSHFASGLFMCEDALPTALRDMVEAELARIDVPHDSEREERRRAEFFTWLAVRVIAPTYLRRAGYDHLGADCENQSDLWNGKLALVTAHYTIGERYFCSPTPRLANFAYGASTAASHAASYAGHEDIEEVVETGNTCAWALLGGLPYEDRDPAEAAAIWDFAVRAINAALELPPGENVRHDLILNLPA